MKERHVVDLVQDIALVMLPQELLKRDMTLVPDVMKQVLGRTPEEAAEVFEVSFVFGLGDVVGSGRSSPEGWFAGDRVQKVGSMEEMLSFDE
jgi:hypothetical protein